MSLFKHAMVSGINDALVDRGIVAWPNERVGFEVCSKLAADLSGPDMLPEGGLSPESALLIGGELKEASDRLIAHGYRPEPEALERTKQAAYMDFTDRAAILAEACMSKAAADASLTNVGANTPESAAKYDQHAKLDQRNRSTGQYNVGVGKTGLPNGGVVGHLMPYPGYSGQSPRNSLTSLNKQADLSSRAQDMMGSARDSLKDLSPRARAMLIGGGTGAAVGGTAGALSDDEHAMRNALIGAGAGAGLGVAGGVGVDALLKHREALKQMAAEAGIRNGNPRSHEYTGADPLELAAQNKSASLSDRARAMLIGGGTGAAVGGVAGALSDDEHAMRNALIGAGAGGALGAGGGAGVDALLKHREALKQMAAEAGIRNGNPRSHEYTGADPLELAAQNKKHSSFKWASEDMSAADLGGVDPEEAEKTMMFLQAMKNKGYDPGAEAQVAAAGLGQDGEPGLEVMAHIIENVKTASEADATFAQILRHQGQTGKLASAQLVNVVEYLMNKQADLSSRAQDMMGSARDSLKDLSPRARAMLIGGGTGAAVGGVAGGLSDDEHAMRNALIGAGAGGALGAGGGAGVDALLRHREALKQMAAEAGIRNGNPRSREYTGADPLELAAQNKSASLSDRARAMLIGGGTGAAVGGVAGGLSDDEHAMRNALIGAGAGGALGAGGGAGVDALLRHREALKQMAAEAGIRNGNPRSREYTGADPLALEAQNKSASLLHYLKAAADGSLTNVGQNTPDAAAQHDQHAALDLQNRAANAYLAGVGNTALPGGKQVYDIHQVPGGERANNSLTEQKSAELAYVDSFRKIASEMGPHLPATMGRETKIAHLQTMLGLPPTERVGYLRALRNG